MKPYTLEQLEKAIKDVLAVSVIPEKN